MLIHLDGRFAYLAMTKTGSTAVETAIRGRCQVLFTRDHRVSHMPAHQFERFVRPYLDHCGFEPIDSVCQLRHPVSWLESWWRYRSGLAGDASTAKLSFERFANDYMEGAAATRDIHRPRAFLCDGAGAVIVDLIFRFEEMDVFAAFLETRTGSPVTLKRENRSPRRWARLSKPTRQRLEAFFAPEIAIWEGGTVRSPSARKRTG